jgi:hypothetical protein
MLHWVLNTWNAGYAAQRILPTIVRAAKLPFMAQKSARLMTGENTRLCAQRLESPATTMNKSKVVTSNEFVHGECFCRLLHVL